MWKTTIHRPPFQSLGLRDHLHRRLSSSLSHRPNATHLAFPGAVKSEFTRTLSFVEPSTHPALPTYRVISPDGTPLSTTWKPDLSEDEVRKYYRDMLFVAEMDSVMLEAQRQGRISFYLVSAGEEAVAVGSAGALKGEDVVYCQYREQGVFRTRGFTTAEFMGQLFANREDTGRGRNMPVHYGSRRLNIHTISSTLATQLPQSSGTAYALKYKRLLNSSLPDRIVATYFGEGAASEGDFHAALNIASTRGCPVVFVCRNNGYAISTPTLEQYRGDGIASRGIGYGIDTIRVDGNDFWAVREVMAEARRRALMGGGQPVLVEAMTYRVSHHSTSDDSFAYREKMEVEDWRRRDNPIGRLRKWMEGEGIWSEEKEKEARKESRMEIMEGFRKGEKEKKPGLRSMFEDVYEEMTPEIEGQMERLREVLGEYPEEYDIERFEGGIDSLKS